VEYEITDSEEEKSMKTKNSSKVSSKKQGDKSEQSSFFETALKMKEEEMKNKDIVVNIDNNNNELTNGDNDDIKPPKNIENNNEDDNNISNSFKNVFDSMENIKIRLSNSQLNSCSSYSKINFNKTDTEFMRDIKRMRYVVSRINASHNLLKKALYEMKGNPFSIPDDEPYIDLASECNTESVADVNVDYCEDEMFNVDEADVFEKYILCVDEENREKFADHYENLYNVNELFKKTVFSSPDYNEIEDTKEPATQEIAAA